MRSNRFLVSVQVVDGLVMRRNDYPLLDPYQKIVLSGISPRTMYLHPSSELIQVCYETARQSNREVICLNAVYEQALDRLSNSPSNHHHIN